jgi:hypothetical protein
LNDERGDFAISDLLEIGYSKRRLADILHDLAAAGILSELRVRNQLRYTFVSRDECMKLLGGIPTMIHWQRILAGSFANSCVLSSCGRCSHRSSGGRHTKSPTKTVKSAFTN